MKPKILQRQHAKKHWVACAVPVGFWKGKGRGAGYRGLGKGGKGGAQMTQTIRKGGAPFPPSSLIRGGAM